MRESPDGGLYLIASVVVVRGELDAMDHAMRSVLGGRRRRVHWHNESVKDRCALVETLAGLKVRAVCVAVQPHSARRQERARERALWTLVPTLAREGVAELVFENRQVRLNRRDDRTLGAIRRAGLVDEQPSHRFVLPDRHAPGLWAADVIAGAVGLDVAGGDDRSVKDLPEGFLTVHRVPG